MIPGIRRSISMGSARSNETHQSTTDPDSRLFKKAKGTKRSWPISAKC